MRKIWFFLLLGFSLVSLKTIPEKTITGTVTSADDGTALPGVNIVFKGTSIGVVTNEYGKYSIKVPDNGGTLVFSFIGLQTIEVKIESKSVIDVQMYSDAAQLSEVVVTGYGISRESKSLGNSTSTVRRRPKKGAPVTAPDYTFYQQPVTEQNSEEYEGLTENIFKDVIKEPLSTFSIDVDKASYSNIRRFINNGQRPPAEAVRIEELINYFTYEYAQPDGDHPFAVHTEISESPWNSKHKLVQIGIQGKNIPTDNLPASNLVFLIDVSGSMDVPNKLPLVKQSFGMLVDQLRPQDHVAIVVYAGAAGVVLPPTSGDQKKKINNSLDRLQAGGSTAGGAGLRLAYNLAAENFLDGGNNRVIIATDGDFNVGESSNDEMEKLITQKRKEGIFLTVLGYGMGNYKDSKLEILADKGNGNYAYIDNISEARKTLVSEFGGTLFTIAKDVKLQLEFNPQHVKAYRLIGYENRMLKDEDFNNDKKDAGELGSGHTVTALYEIIPAGVKSEFFHVDDLKYQKTELKDDVKFSDELLTIKLRYKKPSEDESKLITHAVRDVKIPLSETSQNFRWASSVAAFGMMLRDSEYIRDYSYDEIVSLAQSARGKDEDGYRAEFVNMVKSFGMVAKK